MTTKLIVKKPLPARFPAYRIVSDFGEVLATVPITASGDSHKLALVMAASPALVVALQMAVPALEWCQKQWENSPQCGDGVNVLKVVHDALKQAEG